jgi:hypothetical protein
MVAASGIKIVAAFVFAGPAVDLDALVKGVTHTFPHTFRASSDRLSSRITINLVTGFTAASVRPRRPSPHRNDKKCIDTFAGFPPTSRRAKLFRRLPRSPPDPLSAG